MSSLYAMDTYVHLDGTTRIVCGGRGCLVHEWNLRTLAEEGVLRGHSEPIFSLVTATVSSHKTQPPRLQTIPSSSANINMMLAGSNRSRMPVRGGGVTQLSYREVPTIQ
jgi:hypothetical protein